MISWWWIPATVVGCGRCVLAGLLVEGHVPVVSDLSSGVEQTEDPLTLHPLIAEDLDHQMREMEQARDAAAVSSRDYLIHGEQR